MKRWALAIGAGLLGLVWLSACGPKGPSGTEVTVRLVSPLDGGSPATATVVYQVGDGDWQLASQKGYGVYAFTVPSNEKRYGVAVNCIPQIPILTTLGMSTVYQLTTDEAKELKIACLNVSDLAMRFAFFKAKRDPADTASYDPKWVYTSLANDSDSTLGHALSLPAPPRNEAEVLLIAYNGSYTPGNIARVIFDRHADLSPGHCTSASPCEWTFHSSDAPTRATVDPFTTPGWATESSYSVGFVSKKGLHVPHKCTGRGDDPALGCGDSPGGFYVQLPNTTSGDVYYAEAGAGDGGSYAVDQVVVRDYTGGDITFTLPTEKFDPSVEEKALPKFTGLTYSDPELIGFAFTLEVSDIYHSLILVSKGWLGASGEYAIPDLSGAPDFGGTTPLKGDFVVWNASAIMANKSIGEILSGDPLPLPNPLPRIPGLSIRMASKKGQYTVP